MNKLTVEQLIEQGYINIGKNNQGIEIYAALTPECLSKEQIIQCHIVRDNESMGIAYNIPMDILEMLYIRKDKFKRIV